MAVTGALLAETRRRPGRLLLTGLAIVVATVFAAGTVLLAETLRTYLTEDSQVTPVAAAAVVRGNPMPDGADPVAVVAGVDGVAAATPVWSGFAPVSGAGSGRQWMIGSDPFAGPLSRLAPLTAGRLPAAPDEVLMSAASAARTGAGPGTALAAATGDGSMALTVTGVVEVSTPVDALIAFPDTVAALGGSLQQIDVAAAPGVSAATLVDRLGAAVGAPDAVRTGSAQRAAEAADASASVTALLVGVGIFAALAVGAAAVVVASTLRIVLTQRRTQLALLRCVGASRGQVIRAVLAEAFVTGLVAGVVGLGLAIGAGAAVLAAIGASGTADVPELVLWWPGLLGVVAVAVLATVAAGVAPALAAGRIPPVAALGSAGAGEAGAPRPVRRLLAAAVLAAGAGGLAALASTMSDSAELAAGVVAVSGVTMFAALVVAGPVLVRGLSATAGRIVAAVGRAPGRLAAANAAQVPRRTAATVSVLALGVGLTSALLVALATVQADSEASIAAKFPTEIVVQAPDAAAVGEILAGDGRLAVEVTGDAVLVDPAPGVPDEVAVAAVNGAVPPGALVQYAGDAREYLDTVLGTARMVGLGLAGMTALVAIVGVGVTLTLSVTERTRETGLLRAVGLGRGGVRAMVAWEAALAGFGAAVVGAAIGAGYGLLGVATLGLSTAGAEVPYLQLAGLAVGVVVVAVLAALAPAVRAGRVSPMRALLDA